MRTATVALRAIGEPRCRHLPDRRIGHAVLHPRLEHVELGEEAGDEEVRRACR